MGKVVRAEAVGTAARTTITAVAAIATMVRDATKRSVYAVFPPGVCRA